MLSVEYFTNRVFNSRTYIITRPDCNKVWLVDCGDTDHVLELIGEKTVEGVLLTHAHSDHIYGLETLIKLFPNVKIYTNAAGVEALKSPKINISHYHDDYPDISIEAPGNVCIVSEDDMLEVMGIPIQIYETPGHTTSCLTYIIEDKIFTGDAYIPGVKVFTGFPHSNRKQAQESVERIVKLAEGRIFLPGHTLAKDEAKDIV